MKLLPAPTATLAGCVWLPRILAKARLSAAGQLPEEYAARFGHPGGVDGQFLSFFGLSRADVEGVCGKSDEEVAAWFLDRDGISGSRIQEWNHIAVNLGRTGFPMADRLPIALATSYSHLADRGLETVLSVIEADEAQP